MSTNHYRSQKPSSLGKDKVLEKNGELGVKPLYLLGDNMKMWHQFSHEHLNKV